jgi:hypothetical protein
MSTFIGHYSVSGSTRPWLKTINETKNLSKRKKREQILYPLFEECASLVEDPYWINIFTRASQGKFPKKIRFKDMKLFCKRAKKNYVIDLPEDAIEATKKCLDFFHKYGDMISTIEEKANIISNVENRLQKEIIWDGWKKVSKPQKFSLVVDYITSMENELKLNSEEKKQLHSTITTGILLDYFKPCNIIIGKGYIEKIEGLCYNPETRIFFISPNSLKKRNRNTTVKHSKEIKQKKKRYSFSEEWEKLWSNVKIGNPTLPEIARTFTPFPSLEIITDRDDVYTPSPLLSPGITIVSQS